MTDLLLQPAPAGRNEYEVIIADGGQIVGRIALFNSAPAATPWMWVINFAFHDDREVTHGVRSHAGRRHARRSPDAGTARLEVSDDGANQPREKKARLALGGAFFLPATGAGFRLQPLRFSGHSWNLKPRFDAGLFRRTVRAGAARGFFLLG
jgi:hypothetical protein